MTSSPQRGDEAEDRAEEQMGAALGVSPQVAAALDRLDQLVQEFEQQADPDVRERVFEMLRCVDAVHRQGLRSLVAVLKEAGVLQRALDEADVVLLFELYQLDEGGERARADGVLDSVRPYIESHGGRLEVVEARDGVVTVRLSGACQGCSGSAATLRQVVEETLRAELSDFARVEVLDATPSRSGDVIPAAALLPRDRPGLIWHDVLALEEIPPGELRSVDVEGISALVVNLRGEFYAYENVCPASPLPLHGARLEDSTLVCPWHGCRFSLPGGRRLDRQGPGLGVIPIGVADGQVQIGVLGGGRE